jgi:F-type H+-transporting ATPase subunit epsilon
MVVTPEKRIFQGDADMVVARSPEGEFGIMTGHIPFLAALVPGKVSVINGGDREEFFVPGGFLEASGTDDDGGGTESDYHVIVLADDAEGLDEIDPSEAKRRLDQAVRNAEQAEGDEGQAEVRAARARVDIASRSR